MLRDPAIHIRRSDLLQICKEEGITFPEDFVENVMVKAVKKKLNNRTLVTTKARNATKAARTVVTEDNIVADFNRIYTATCLKHQIRTKPILRGTKPYLTLKEIATNAYEFHKDYGFTSDNRYHYWIKAEIRYVLKSKPPAAVVDRKPRNAGPLTVEAWAEKKKFKAGEQMKFFIRGNKNFYARVIYIDANNNKLQLIPNKYNSNNYFEGGKTIEIPGSGEGYTITVSPPFGKEKIIVFASTSPQGDIIIGSKDGPLFQVNDDMSVIEVQTRGVQIQKDESAEFYETSCEIKTVK